MEAQALLTLGVAECAGGPAWIDDKEFLFAFGNGVVAQHINKGSQRHVFGEANMELGASSTDASAFATCPQKQVIAHAQSGLASSISIAPATSLRPHCTIKDPQQQHAPWVHLAFSHDGKHLAYIGSYPEHVLEVWDLPEPPAPLKLGAKSEPPDPATASARLVASATLGPRLAQLPPAFFPLNRSVLAVGGPEAVRLLFFDASVADNCIVRQSDVDLSAMSEGHQITSMGWTPAGALMLGTSGGKIMLVPGAAPCGLADADWGTTPSSHKARSMFNSSVAARSRGWFDGLGNVIAVACLPGQQTLAVVSPWPAGSKTKASNDTVKDRGGNGKAHIQQPHCAHLMWLDTSGSSTTLAALAALPYGSLSSAAVSPSLEHVLLRTVTGDLALAETTYTIPEQLPRLTKTGTLAVTRMAARNKTVRMHKEHSGGSSMSQARNKALQVVDEEEHNSSNTSTDRRPSDQGSPPSSVGSPPASRGPSLTQLGDNSKSFKGSLPLTTAMAAVVNARWLARYHAGRIAGVVALDEEVFATGGEDTTLRLWQCAHVSPAASLSSLPSETSTPNGSRPSSRMASRSSSPVPAFHLPPSPPRVPVLDASLLGMWRLRSPLTTLMRFADTPLVVAGTAGGEVHVLHTQKLMDYQQRRDKMQGAEDTAKEEAEAYAASAVWEQRPFSHSIAAMAFSSDGTLFAAASPDQNQVVLYRVVPIGTSLADITLQLLGFYDIFQPYLLSFSPKDLSAIERGRAGAPPLLVVGTTLGELQLLHMPQSLNHLRADDALIPPVSLLHGLLRVQSPITAMLTMPITTAGGHADTTVLDGAFWLVACCADKSIKRIRMPQQQHCDTARAALSARAAAIEQQQRMGRAPPFSVPRVGMATSQNFQMPEIEKPMELDAPACHISLSQTDRQLVVSCLSGTVVVFGFPDLIAFARWPLHAPVAVQETALAQSLGSSRLPSPQQQHARGGVAVLTTSLLVSVGPEGCVCMASLEGSSLLGIAGATGKYEASKAPDTSAKPTPRPTSAAARRGFQVNGVTGLSSAIFGAGQARPAYDKIPPILARSADTAGVLGWKEAPLAARRKSKAASIEEAHEKLRAKKQDLARRLKELRALNASQGEERLGDHEFVVDVALEQELRREADEVVGKAKTQATVDIEVPEVMYHRILAFAKRATQEQQQHLVSLPEYRFISVLSADDMKRWKDAGSVVKVPGVSSYSIKRLSVDEADKLRKVTFLRRVEQDEWQQRPFYQRGDACLLRRWKGSLGGKPNEGQAEADQSNVNANGSRAESQHETKSNLTGADKEDEFGGDGGDTDGRASGQAPTYSPRPQQEDSHSLSATYASEAGDMSAREREAVSEGDVLGCEVFNGACHLLYSDFQLHAPTRKASQTVFLQEEIRCLQREFNSQFARLRTLKHQELERLNDKGKRIETIQNSLQAVAANAAKAFKFIKSESKNGPSVAPPASNSGNAHEAHIEYNWDACEHWENLLHVADEEVPVDRFASPEMRAKQRARQAEAEEQRRRLEADDSKQRALRDMMNSTLEFRKKGEDAEDLLKYEPWMDLPRASLTTEQRKLMAELEKRAMEVMEECEKATRQLEMERKAVEADIYGHVVEFNAKVAALYAARLKADSQLRVFELQSVDLAHAIEELRASTKARDQVSSMDKRLARRRNLRTTLLTEAQAVARKAALEYEAIQGQERALDRAMRREFTSVDEDLRDEAVAFYRDRWHALSGNPVRPASEILANVAEGATVPGQSRPRTSGTNRDPASGLKRAASSKSQRTGRRFGGPRPSESGAAVAAKADPVPAPPDNDLPEPTPVPELARWQAMLHAGKRSQAHKQATSGLSASQLEALNTSGGFFNGHRQSRAGSVWAPGSVRAFGSQRGAESIFAYSRLDMDQAVDWELVEHSVEGIMTELQATLSSHAKQQLPYQRLQAILHTVNSRGLGSAAQQLAAGGSIRSLFSEAAGSPGPLGGLFSSTSQKQLDLMQTEQRRTSSPGDGSRGHQLRQEQAAERLLRQSSIREDEQVHNHPFVSPLARTLFDPSSAPIATTAAEMLGVEEPLSLPPFSAADKPAELEHTWWHRLQEFRDSRIELEREGDAAWHRLVMATYQLERLEHEEQHLNNDLEAITDTKVSLHMASVEAATDVLLQYRLQNGQVELPSVSTLVASGTHRGKPPSAMYIIQGITASDALFLHRQSIVHVNTGVLNEGQKKVAALHDIKRSNTAIHLARWEVSRSEVRGRHAAAELSHVQLMHVTKDLQAVLRNPTAMSRLDQESQLLALAEAAHASHEARKALKSRTVQNLTARIANNIEVQEELSAARAAAEVDKADGAAIAEVITRSRTEEENAHRRALRSIVTNVQLKDIASAQTQELAALQAQLDVFQARTYPNINRAASAASMPFGTLSPDVRIPHLSPGGVRSRPASVPVGFNRPLWSAGSSRGAVISGAAPAPTSSRPKMAPRPYTTLGAARRQKQVQG